MIFKAMVMVLSLTACACLAACSDDNDDPDTPSGSDFKSITADYSLTVSEDYLAIYDLVADYSFDDEHHSESINSTTWTLNKSFTSNQPKHFTCVVTATPRANLPQYDADAKVTLSEKYSIAINGTYKNGQTTLLKTASNSHSNSLKGSKVAEQVAKGPRTIIKLDYTR